MKLRRMKLRRAKKCASFLGHPVYSLQCDYKITNIIIGLQSIGLQCACVISVIEANIPSESLFLKTTLVTESKQLMAVVLGLFPCSSVDRIYRVAQKSKPLPNDQKIVLQPVNQLKVLDILCVTYFLTSVTLPDPQTSDMRQIR